MTNEVTIGIDHMLLVRRETIDSLAICHLEHARTIFARVECQLIVTSNNERFTIASTSLTLSFMRDPCRFSSSCSSFIVRSKCSLDEPLS
jgi:hypothetical protein